MATNKPGTWSVCTEYADIIAPTCPRHPAMRKMLSRRQVSAAHPQIGANRSCATPRTPVINPTVVSLPVRRKTYAESTSPDQMDLADDAKRE